MKKIGPVLLLSILTLILLATLFIPVIIEAAKDPQPSPAAKGHLVFDPIDKVFRCFGDPINCA